MRPTQRRFNPELSAISETTTVDPTTAAASVALKPSSVAQLSSRGSVRMQQQQRRSVSSNSRTSRSNSAPCIKHEPLRIEDLARPRASSARDINGRDQVTITPKPDAAAAAPKKIEVEVDPKYGRTALHNAARKGDVLSMQKLLQEQPELLKYPDFRGNHPLHYAAANVSARKGAPAVYMLLEAGAFVNAVNMRQQTPLSLHVISTEDDDDLVVRMLLHFHAKPSVKVSADYLLPQYATSRGYHKIAAALREFM